MTSQPSIQDSHPDAYRPEDDPDHPAHRPPLWVHLIGAVAMLISMAVAHLVPRTAGDGWIRAFSDFWSGRGNDAFLILGIGALVWLAYRRRSKLAFWRVAAPVLVETAIMQTCQKVSFHVFGLWPRPSGTDGGFPSGHSAASTVVAFALTERFPWGAPLWYGIAALITWSRVESGAHYPYQLVGGVLLGAITAFFLVPRFYKRVPAGTRGEAVSPESRSVALAPRQKAAGTPPESGQGEP